MEKQSFTQDKMKRIAVAATVAGVLLAVFLVIVLIIQFCQIGVKKREIKEYNRMIDEYSQSIEQDGKELEAYRNGDALYYLALKRGWNSGK